jgi:hypothetical protein
MEKRRRAQGARLREKRKALVPPKADPSSVVRGGKSIENRARHPVPYTPYLNSCLLIPGFLFYRLLLATGF